MSRSVGRHGGRSRRRIARLLNGGPRTVAEIASALDTVDGALRSAVAGMERDGQLRRAEPRVRRGQRWELTDAGRAELVERAPPGEPGLLLPGQRLLVLVDQGEGVPPGAWRALRERADLVLWAARLDGNGPLVLALESAAAADELRALLAAAGATSVAGRVRDLVDGAALARAVPRPRAS